MMKWLHLPWHIDGNRIIKTRTGETIIRFAPGVVPVERRSTYRRPLSLSLAVRVFAINDGRSPW